MASSDKKLGTASMVFIFLNLSLAKYLLVVPSFIVQNTGNSAWMVLILKGIAALVLFAAVAALYRPYVELGFGEVTRRAAGKLLGGVLNFLLAAVIITRGAFLFRTLAEALRTLEAEDAPLEYMAVFILIPVAVCALKGFNINSNMCALIIPFTVISVAAIAAALVPHFRLENIMPLLGEGAESVLVSSFGKYGGFFEIIFMLIFSKYTGGYKTFKRSGFIGIGVISLITAAFTLMYCAAIPYPASKDFFFPLYQLTRLIKAGAFVQRLEPLIVFIWAGIVLCSLTTVVLGGCELLTSAAGAKDFSAFAPLLTIIIFFIGVLPPTELAAYNAYRAVLNISHYVYPAVIFIVLLIARGRKIEYGVI